MQSWNEMLWVLWLQLFRKICWKPTSKIENQLIWKLLSRNILPLARKSKPVSMQLVWAHFESRRLCSNWHPHWELRHWGPHRIYLLWFISWVVRSMRVWWYLPENFWCLLSSWWGQGRLRRWWNWGACTKLQLASSLRGQHRDRWGQKRCWESYISDWVVPTCRRLWICSPASWQNGNRCQVFALI